MFYLYDFYVVASEHLGEWLESTKLNKFEYLSRTSSRCQISDGPSCLLFGLEIANFQDFDQISKKVAVHNHLDLIPCPSSDVGKGPSCFLNINLVMYENTGTHLFYVSQLCQN